MQSPSERALGSESFTLARKDLVVKLGREQLLQVEEIEGKAFFWDRLFEEMIPDPSIYSGINGVLNTNGEVIGYIRWSWTDTGTSISRLYVDERYRHHGLEQRMVEGVLAYAGEKPVEFIAKPNDLATMKLLLEKGFYFSESREKACVDPISDGLVFVYQKIKSENTRP